MATVLAHDAAHDDWAAARVSSIWTRAQWLALTLLTVALLGAFLFFVVDDYPLRSLIAVQ
jgi:hypothetical protein